MVKGDVTTNEERQHDAETPDVNFWAGIRFGIE
jgi:hypothetical protein